MKFLRLSSLQASLMLDKAESLFYLYRLTGDEKCIRHDLSCRRGATGTLRVNPKPRYRRWGEKMFNAILDNAKAFRTL